MKAPRRLGLLLGCLLSFGWLAAQTTFTWTGNSTTSTSGYKSASASTGANWSGGVAPTSEDNALLAFGSSTGASAGSDLAIQFPYSFAARGLMFASPMPDYYLSSNDGGRLRLGDAGLTFSGSGNSLLVLGSRIELTGNQTWAINDGTVYAYGRITESATGTSLTKTGGGTLILDSSDSGFGSLNVQGGTLYVGASSALGDSDLISGPVGSGTLTLGDNTRLRTSTSDDVTLHNAIVLGNNVTLGNVAESDRITLAGAITPLSTATTVRLGVDGALFLTGGIANAAGGATTLTFTNNSSGGEQTTFASSSNEDNAFPVAVLAGNNTYTGATVVDHAGVIFFTPGSLGATSAIAASSGYVGTGYSGGLEAILAKINQPGSFDGALGFDTNPDLSSTPTVFTDTVNLASFANDNGGPTSGFWGLGTMTSATLRTGTITPPSGGNYVFGGGSGKLYVETNLGVPANSTAAGVRVRTPSGDDPLTVWLRGANTFAGNLMSDHSIVVLDSATALPTGSSYSVDSGAYVGYTENFTAGGASTVTPAQFIARLVSNAYNSDSVLGFDAADPNGRTISDPVNLGSFEDIFIGTTTHVHLQGTLTAPSASRLSVTGLNGGWLTIDAPLLATNVGSLLVGATNSDLHRRGYVELSSGASDFGGGTTFNSGYLLLGASSTVNGSGAITQGPLGTGTLTVNSSYDWDAPATIAATTAGVTLHNNFAFSSGALQFGVPVTSDDENLATKAQAYTGNGLTLNGTLSGNASLLAFSGNGTFTLNGANGGLSSSWIRIGDSLATGTPLVVAATDTALGGTGNSLYLGSGADLQFTSAAPLTGSLSGGYTAGYDTNNRSFVALAAGSTLTINQAYDGTLYANIGGTPANFSGSDTASVNASLVKSGAGQLTLSGTNTYTGTTTVKGGMLIAGSTTAFGTSAIVLDGGGIGAASGIVFTNAISFGAGGGTLGGNGTIASAITAGPQVKIAPGNSPGQLTFTSNLTFAGGGTASFDIANFAGSAGSGWDQIVVSSTGAFALTATVANPFTIQVNSWSAANDALGALSTDFSSPASLAILQTSAPITGLIGSGESGSSNLVLNLGNFTAYQAGTFSLSLSNDSTALLLNFTPVPEPSTGVLLGLGLVTVVAAVRRQRSRRS